MRLPPGSRALRRRRSGLPHSVLQRAPWDGTVGLRNPASRDPARERSDKVFGERSHATTGFFSNTDADDYFPNVDDLLGNMSSSANASGSSSAPYVLLVFLSDMMQYVLLFPICLDLFISYFVVDHMSSLFPIFLAIFYLLFLWFKSYRKLLIFPTIQKPYRRQFSPIGFAASLRPLPFEGVHYKRWRARATLWFETMKCFDAAKGKPEGELTPAEEKAFQEADTLFRGAVLSVLGENIVDSYMSIAIGKDMWDALKGKFGFSDAGSELYVMEQFYDYKMSDERSVVQ